MLEVCEPAAVFRFFEEICAIPHGSGNEKALSQYLHSFAEARGLWVKQDEALNIIIKKPASKNKEASQPVILQGHMDMVCEKNLDTLHDFQTESIQPYVEGDFIKARGTTLGADNGIAVAMALALLDSREISHPPLEVVITTDEEVGLLGAKALDAGDLTAKRLINLDSEEEGNFCTSCAGGLKVTLNLPVETISISKSASAYRILKVEGLQGGHSGAEIHKERANSIRILGRALDELRKEFSFSLWDINGGLKDNAIPREARAYLAVDPTLLESMQQKIDKLSETYRHEYRISDPGLQLRWEESPLAPDRLFTSEFTKKLITAMLLTPNGVQAMSLDVQGLVETSNNMGVIKLSGGQVRLASAVRSSVTARKYMVRDQILLLADMLGGSAECFGDYPGWEYNPASPLMDLFSRVYEEYSGVFPHVTAIHAGLECGYFAQKIPGIDLISLGPNIFGAHTPEERLSVSSTKKIWEFLLKALEEL